MPRSPNSEPVLVHRLRITRALIRWGRRNARYYPWREEMPLWQALIAEVMLQRTRAEQVVPTFNEFRVRYPSPAALARASNEELAGLVEPLGLHWRARLLHRLAREIARMDGALPLDQPALEALPGVGPYAAQRHALPARQPPSSAHRLELRARSLQTGRSRVRQRDASEALAPRAGRGCYTTARTSRLQLCCARLGSARVSASYAKVRRVPHSQLVCNWADADWR